MFFYTIYDAPRSGCLDSLETNLAVEKIVECVLISKYLLTLITDDLEISY